MEQLTLPIIGMNSDKSAAILARALERQEFVAEAAVNNEFGTAKITLTEQEADLHELVSCVRQAGFDVESEKVVLAIEGMSCLGCAGHVQFALEDAAGVIQAKVDLATEEASVVMLAGSASLDNLQAAVEEAGYRIRVKESANLKTTI